MTARGIAWVLAVAAAALLARGATAQTIDEHPDANGSNTVTVIHVPIDMSRV